jgi:sulfonate transport system permease protein
MDAGANFARAVGGCRYRAIAAERRSAGAVGIQPSASGAWPAAGRHAGTLLGALFGLVPAAAQRVEPLFYALAQIPTLGWIPLFMVLFGIDNGLKLAVIVKTTVVPMTINTQQAVAGVPLTLSEAARVMNFSRWQRLRWLVIPASLPGWFTGLRLALSQAWVSLIVVELLASSEGIGYLMVWGRQLFQLDIVFVTIAVVGLSGMLMEWAANRACARLVFWPQPAAGRLAWKPQASWRALQLPLVLLALWQLASQWGWIDGACSLRRWRWRRVLFRAP